MILRLVMQIFFAGVLASTALMTTHAQNPPPDTPAPTRVDQQRGIDPDFEQRKNDMRLLDKTMHPRDASKNNIRKRRDPKVVAEEIAEDFTRLQVVNNELGQAVSAPVPLKLEFVIKSAAELAE